MMEDRASAGDLPRADRLPAIESATRRNFMWTAAAGGTLAIVTADAGAATPALATSGRDLLDRLAVADTIQRERTARDAFQFDEMARYWHPDSRVEVSWFKGTGAEFVAASHRNVRPDRLSLHQLSPSVVTVNGDRAIAETPTQLLSFADIDGVAVCNTSSTRLLWRARRQGEDWLIAGLHMIYMRDYLLPCTPGQPVRIDQDKVSRYRASYRYLSYVLAQSGHATADDLPGIDRPEMVAALRAQEAAWLATG